MHHCYLCWPQSLVSYLLSPPLICLCGHMEFKDWRSILSSTCGPVRRCSHERMISLAVWWFNLFRGDSLFKPYGQWLCVCVCASYKMLLKTVVKMDLAKCKFYIWPKFLSWMQNLICNQVDYWANTCHKHVIKSDTSFFKA